MTTYRIGEPCNHLGCLRHISHPCEGCGRIAGFPPEYVGLSLGTAYELQAKGLVPITKEALFELMRLSAKAQAQIWSAEDQAKPVDWDFFLRRSMP